MSAPTINGSRYPVDVEELMPAARDLAIAADRVPAINELRRDLAIGYDKAREIHRRLVEQARQWDEAVAIDASLTDPGPVDEPLTVEVPEPQVTPVVELPEAARRKLAIWPLILLALPASVAIWSGWVGLGGLTGFGPVRLLPGILDEVQINTAITLPIGMETYAAYALRVWLSPGLPGPARKFAMWSAIGSLLLGWSGQIAYHLMTAAHMTHAPWEITTLVAGLPVAVLGMGAALAHLLRNGDQS